MLLKAENPECDSHSLVTRFADQFMSCRIIQGNILCHDFCKATPLGYIADTFNVYMCILQSIRVYFYSNILYMLMLST